jgi:transposase
MDAGLCGPGALTLFMSPPKRHRFPGGHSLHLEQEIGMNYYKRQHELYCGIDLHARRMYACVVDQTGDIRFHQNLRTRVQDLKKLFSRFPDRDLAVGVESTYNWYWLADTCEDANVPFVLGHALEMRAIHGSKTKNDKQDSLKIAMLLRGGNFPSAYVYPRATRAQRDLIRRRCFFSRQRAELQTHVRNTAAQYNLPVPKGQLMYQCHQEGVAESFPNPAARLTIETDLAMINALTAQLKRLEKQLAAMARFDDPGTYFRLKAVPGIGDILALVILYEIGEIARFPTAGDFLSYARLVPGQHTSNGKNYGSPGRKQGNPQLKWAFSEAISLLLANSPVVKAAADRLKKRHGAGKALSILGARLGRAVYLILKRGDIFDEQKFLQVK